MEPLGPMRLHQDLGKGLPHSHGCTHVILRLQLLDNLEETEVQDLEEECGGSGETIKTRILGWSLFNPVPTLSHTKLHTVMTIFVIVLAYVVSWARFSLCKSWSV